jgi:branched-chain amino acid transport system substrate-binding protein
MRRYQRLGAAAFALALCSCSFIVAGTFKECENDSQCKDTADGHQQVCLKTYCVPMPDLCQRESGAFDVADPIRIGAPLPLTTGGLPDAGGVPDDSEYGALNSIKLAIDEFNVRTIDGRKFALYTCNTGRVASVINARATWLADELGAKALIFSGSGQGIEAHKVTAQRDVLLISATATSPELINVHQTSGLLWRTAPPDSLQGRVLADFVKTDPAFATVSRISVVYVDDAYGQGLKTVLQSQLPAPTYTVRSIPYVEGEDLTPVVNALDLQNPQLTILIAFRAEAKEILDRAIALPSGRLTAAQGHRWMFTDSAKDPAIISATNLPHIADAFGFAPSQGAGIAYSSFSDRYILKFGFDPSQYSFLSHAYDAMYVLGLAHAYALGKGDVTGNNMREGIEKMSSGTNYQLDPTNLSAMLGAMKTGTSINIDGTSGKLDFNPDAGAPGAPIERWQITDGGSIVTRSTVEVPLSL